MEHRAWPRIIAHVDMDAFFAQIEQRDFPALRGKPVCITNGERGSTIITRSYEARAYGVTTGMRLVQARQRCPQLIRQPSRPHVYTRVSAQIMMALESVSPDMEIFSVDEAFLDLSRCRGLYRTAKSVGRLMKQRVWDACGLTCSVGISGDKTTAKVASKRFKPDGLFVIAPWHAGAVLAPLPVTEICGINKGVAQFLAQYGVYYCGQMSNIPISVLARRFGRVGRRLWHMCLGKDPDLVRASVAAPKSIGHGKVMPPNTTDKSVILNYLCHMAEKVGKRLRTHNMTAQVFCIGIKTQLGWLTERYKTVLATNDGLLIYQLAKGLVEQHWQGEGVFQCQITGLHPQLGSGQCDLFAAGQQQSDRLNQVMDVINDKFGQTSIARAQRMQPMAMPDVIAPAWRPSGVRSSVDMALKDPKRE